MSTSFHAAALNAHATASHQASTLGQVLLQRVHAIVARVRRANEERRVREHLAALPDSLLRDIGIADHEIHRIRACERFTPQAWARRMNPARPYWDL